MNPSRKWMTRLIVALNALAVCLLVLLNPESALSKAIEAAGHFGGLAILALVLVGAVAIADTIINDILPARFVLQCALKYRHTVYLLLSLGVLSLLFVIVKTQGITELIAYYGLVSLAAFSVAVIDIRDRMKGLPR